MRAHLFCAVLALAPAAAFADVSRYDTVACPAGQQALLTKRDFNEQIAPYQAGDLDPLPRGKVEKPLPKVYFVRQGLEDPTFPRQGRANAVLLVREDGSVARVLVPCATSMKMVDPIVSSLSKAKLDPATKGGVPVRSMVVVPVSFGY